MLFPDVNKTVEAQQEEQTKANNVKKLLWEFQYDEMAYAKDFRSTGSNVITGIVIERTSPLSYLIKLNNDNIVHCYIDNVRKRYSTSNRYMDTNSDLSHDSMEQSSETSYIVTDEP